MISEKTFIHRLTDVFSWSVFAMILAFSSLILSIIAIATRYPRTEMDFDYLGFILAVLAFITTLLIGYQIASAFISREQIKDMDSKIFQTLNTNLYHVFIIQGRNEENRDHFESALNYYFKSIECADKANLKQELRQVTAKVKQILENANTLQINIVDSDCYCGIIKGIEHEDKDEIITQIKSIASEEVPSQAYSWEATFTTSRGS